MGAIAFFALYAPGRVYDVALAQAVPVLERDLGVDIQYGRRIARGTTLTLEDVRLLDPAADEPTTLASADQLSLTLDPRALVRKQPISGQVEAIRALRRVRLQRPVVHLRRTPKGFDLVDLFAGRQTARPTLPYHLKLEIIDGELHYTDFPLRADGTRDWDTPLPVHLDVDAEGFMRQGILTNAAITVRPPGDTEDLLVLTGGGDFKQAMAGQLRVEMNVGRAFGEGGILANLLPAFGTTLAPVSDYLHRGQVEGTLGFVFGKLPDDPSSPEDESKRWSPPQFSGELVLTDTELRLPGRPDPVLAEAQLELSPGDVRVNRANIRHGPLAAAMTGALSMAEGHPQLTLHFVTTEPFQMPQIAGSLLPFRDTIGYQGPVSAAGTLDVDLPGYTLTAELTSPRVMIAGSPFELIDGSTLKLGYRSAAVGVADLNLQLRNGAQGLGVQGTAHIPRQEYAFNIGVTEVPSALVRRAIPAVQSIPVEGPLSGNIIFLSDPVNRSRADINLMGRDGLAANVPYGALVGRLRYETGKIAIRRLVATPPGRNQGALILHGDYGMGGVMDLHAQLGGVDLAQLLRGSGVSGQLFGRMDLQGTTASPRGTYAAHVLGGEFLGVPFTRLFSEGRFTPTTLTLDSASLVSPGGAAHVSGTIDLTRSPQIRLAGTLLQSGHLVALPAGTAPRNLGGTVEITGDLDAMALAAALRGQVLVGSSRLEISRQDPMAVQVRGLGLQFASLPRSWGQLITTLRTSGLPPLNQPLTLMHSGRVDAVPLNGAGEAFDPFFADALREAAPALAEVVLQAQGTLGAGPALRGAITGSGEWRYDGVEFVGESTWAAPRLMVSEVVLTDTALTVRRSPGAAAVSVDLRSMQRPRGSLALTGTITPTAPLGESPVDLRLTVEDYPVEPLAALMAPLAVNQVDGYLTGGGPIQGTLTNLGTVEEVDPALSGLRFLVREGRIGALAPIEGRFGLAFRENQLTIREMDLAGPGGFHARGAGQIVLSKDDYDKSVANLHLERFPLTAVQPFLPTTAPAVAGVLDFIAEFRFVGGVPNLVATVNIDRPALGNFQLDRAAAKMYYNPFTRVVRINANEPLFLDIQGNRLLVHGTIALQEGGRPPQLNLHIDTPFREGVPIALPIDTVLAPGGPFEAEGGIETISLRVTGPAISPVIQGNVQLALRNIRMLGQPIFQSMGGTLQFEYAPGDEPGEVRSRRLVFPERQFRITNTDGDQSGTVYVVGEIDYPSLAGIRQVGEGQQIGHLALVPSEPGTILPITGFGMQSGLVFQEGSEPLAVQLTSAGIQLSGDLILAPGRLDLRRLPNFGAAVEGGAVVPVPLVFNLRTRFPDGFEVVGPSDLDVELDPGTLTISGNPLAPTVVGRIVARRGSFAVLGREFELTEPATLTFDGIYGLNPLLTAVAETTIEAPDPTALSGRNRVTITVSVSARLQELGDEASPGLTFSSDDPSYSDPGQILALLVGFGGSGSSPANQATLNERFIEGITNAAVAVPGQFVGRFFEEQGFRRFLAGVDFEGDIFLDMEYEVFDQVAVDYFQRFGPNAEWEAGVKYEVRDNSFIRIGTTQERDLVGSLEYRIPLGGADSKASRAAIEAYNAEAHARGETEEAEARELPADFVPLDADKDIEAIPGPPNPDPALPEGEVITPEDPGAQVPLVEPESTGAAEDGSVDTGAAADEDDGDDGAGSSDDESASE